MFGLPESTLVNRFIPKDKFFKKTSMDSKLKQQFTNEIEKITWTHKISPDTLNITKDDTLEELQIFEILLKDRDISKAVLRHIDNSMPYPIIYILRRKTGDVKVMTSKAFLKKQYGINTTNDDFIDTRWSRPSGKFVLHGNIVSHIYIGFLVQMTGIDKQPYSDPKTALERWERNQGLKKQIDVINKKIRSEVSLAKKQELARKRYELEAQFNHTIQ